MSIAFFDVDGTLTPNPSLELRWFHELVRRRKIPVGNCVCWAKEMLRLGVASPGTATLSNKMYLRGVCTSTSFPVANADKTCGWMPEFFPGAIQRVWWHAVRGDGIVLVTGTLLPLAEVVKSALERELLWRGIESNVGVIATRLEVKDGRWTGRVDGAPMYGEAKAIAIRELARYRGVSLERCSAYGDHVLDRWMLAAAGSATAVNPSQSLRRVAQLNGWPVVSWHSSPPRSAYLRNIWKWKGEPAR